MWDLIVSVPDHCLSLYFVSSLVGNSRRHVLSCRGSNNNLLEETVIDNRQQTSSEDIASKLNEYCTSISHSFNNNDTDVSISDLKELEHFAKSKVPDGVYFKIPYTCIIPRTGIDVYKHTRLD